jgi:hypothetical protein
MPSIAQQMAEIAKRARDEAAAKRAQQDAADAAARKAQQDAADAAARKAQQDAADAAARKAQQDAADAARKAQQDAADAAAAVAAEKTRIESIQKAAKTPEILKNVPQSGSIATLGNEIQKQKQKVEENLKLLTSAAIAGSGLLAGGLTSFAKSSNGMNNNQTFSKENRTSVTNLYVIMPDVNTNKKYIKNPDYKNFVKDYGTQIVPYKFYNKDSQLSEYEKFFNDNKSACVPMAMAIDYFSQIQNDDE